ncbi:MAG: hypothetical protein XD95_0735, partial [Microgenomates bacterium 39_7]
IAPTGGLTGPGIKPEENLGDQITGIISTVIGILTAIAIIWFIIEFIISGFLLISSAGDQEKTAEAKKRLTQSLIGLVIVLGAMFLFTIISYIAGIDFLNIGDIINDLKL